MKWETYMRCSTVWVIGVITVQLSVNWWWTHVVVALDHHPFTLSLCVFSVRWKILLQFQCRNRLLLTGTPIQNTMAEVSVCVCWRVRVFLCARQNCWRLHVITVSQLWALLHFIMPTLFDSHDEFNEWFSKDIESHAENKSAIDESEYSSWVWEKNVPLSCLFKFFFQLTTHNVFQLVCTEILSFVCQHWTFVSAHCCVWCVL